MSTAEFRRYALFYLGYFGMLGAYTPYIGRWVSANGHGGYAVGAMLALWYGGRILAPPTWARQVARSRAPGHWLVAGCLLALAMFAGFARFDGGVMLFVVMGAFALFFNAVMPQFEAMTLNALGTRNHDYGKIRMWGSVGFLIVAASYGWLLDRLGNDAFVWLSLPWLVLTAAAAWLHRADPPSPAPLEGTPRERLWRRPGTRRLLGTVLLVQLSFGPFYVFYTLQLQAHGHDGFTVGLLWAIGVVCEILMFWQAPRLVQRFGAHRLIAACIFATALRWVLVAWFADSFAWMALAQTGHSLSFAAFHAGCMRRMAELFPARRDMASAQGMLSGFSGGIGGVLGAGMAALAWQHGGGTAAFMAGSVCSVAALALHLAAQRYARDPRPVETA
ncbi:MFS transporter [Lysobacter antibioticus]|uniref:MFS_1 like family protein n=1 Tax=Lysobacter antibioticus TaxID=84531 RepID=A0A0S2FAW2_LYSAN|nr:MFS transporter [Lysobacter antibioticus]ALN80668.1 MFS_1 like family protein [Lysobacter antibioticus]